MVGIDDIGGDLNKEGNWENADDDLGPERSFSDDIRIIFSETIVGESDQDHIEPEKEEENDGTGGMERIIHLSTINGIDSKLEEDLSDAGHPDDPGGNSNLTIGNLAGVGG